MRISIALPHYTSTYFGGYNVYYTYANFLQARGHQVTIVFPRYLAGSGTWKGRLWTPFWGLRQRLRNRPLIPTFKLHDGVRVRFVPHLGGDGLPKADVLIATAWQTAEYMQHAPPGRGRKWFIVYDYEFWRSATPAVRERIERTYSAGYTIISTSGAVDGMLRQLGAEPVAEIPCGIDFDAFGEDIPAVDRPPLTLGFPGRVEPFKGGADAVAAAVHLRERYGDKLQVTAFGSIPIDLPPWIRWLSRPSQPELRRFYNDNAVFMVPSHYEGFGLPGAEAMACGAALATTDTGGSRDYAIPDTTALVVPPQRPDLLADAVDRLFQDRELRIRLAQRGRDHVQRFQWQTACEALERVLLAA